MMSYRLDTSHDSPNHGGFAQTLALPASLAVVHWWGAPSGQDPAGIIAHLCNPAAQVSAHEVVWPGNVACLVNHDQPSWANGNTWANTHALTFECDPCHVTETIATLTERLADLVRAGALTAAFELRGHRDYYNTACPGDYYPRLGEIRQAVAANLNPTTPPPQPQEDDMPSAQEIAQAVWNMPLGTDATPDKANLEAWKHLSWAHADGAHNRAILDQLARFAWGVGIDQIGSDGKPTGTKTDLVREAAWNATNVARTLRAQGFTDADIQKIRETIQSTVIHVDVTTQGATS